MDIIAKIKDEITAVIGNACATLEEKKVFKFEPGYLVPIEIEIPKEKKNGDFSSNIAMKITKMVQKNPRETATLLLENFDLEGTYIERCEIAGPGFINFYLKPDWKYDALKLIDKMGSNYGKTDVGEGKKVVVEFVSANPTGPMHMGNARGGVIGDVLANILKYAGFDVTKEFYINDAGAQIEKFGKSLEARYIQAIKGEDAIEFSPDWYQGDDIKEHAQNFIKINGDKYIDAPTEERQKALVDYALPINIANLKTGLEAYKINYDVWFAESTLHKNGEVKETIDALKQSGLTYEKDGALWLEATKFGSEKDEVLIRNNGIPTYFAVDIAYHRNKFAIRKFDRAINVWGADHHGHVARMKGAMNAIGLDGEKLEIVIMQLVRLMRNGEVARMSKRTGKMITLSDLIEEIGVDAARFFFNLRHSESHLDFDLDLAVAQNSENPVFYVQYAHARIASIINGLKEEGVVIDKDTDITLLKENEEIDLMEKLAKLPDEISICALSSDPSRITRYVLDLASLFHTFYNAPLCRVKCDDKNLMKARLFLITQVKTVIKNVLDILGIEAPEKM
ncbi:MAG: arginine--tRNA ligase [Ruminococcaceae bacterium]|nr:arginine--tRNA ligase [Oscillospiraceae bacterium]